MVGKQISVPLRSLHVIKKLRTLCAETVARVYPVEVTAAVQVPHGQPGLPTTDHLRTPLSSTSAPPSPAPRRKRDYLNRERVVGVQTWMSSFLPLASEMVDKPLRFASVRDRLRLHGSVPLLRGFSERATSVPVKTDVAAQTEELPVPSATPEASYRLGWILKEIARVPSIFYGTKHEKSVREGRKLRQDFLAPGMESVHTLSDLYLVGQNLVKSLFVPGDDDMKREKVLCLISLVKAHPELLVFLSEIGATKAVLRILSQTSCPSLQGDCRLALALMGYTFPVKGNGVKILSLDGGGTRGVIVVEVLKAIERETGKATHELFDYIVGVSTGAILTTLLGPMRRNLDECEDLYMSLCKELFSDPGWWGTGRLFMSHSLYDTGVWEGLLKEHIGEISLAESAADPDCPKIGLVSAVVRKGLPVTYVFRNYVMPPGYQSRFAGNTGLKHTYRDAVRASSAAPGIFKEAVLSNEIHLDGGTNCNNPTAVAIHECQNLWPGKPIQAVLSIGNGLWDEFVMSDFTKRPVKVPTAKVEWASLWDKLSVFFNSATDTERVHITLRDLLPRDVYFRFNPYMSENIRLDECDPCKLEKLQEETVSYLRRNRRKLDRIVESLTDDNGQKMHVPAFSAKRFAYPPN